MMHFSSPQPRNFSDFLKTHFVDLALAGMLFATALAIRLPNLMHVPPYTDEGFEVLWGLDILLGKHLPLTAIDPYDGPLFAYLIAILFRVFGLSVELPRLMVAVFGAATVVATYLLGRLMYDRTAGLVSAGLALTSPVLVVFSSHQGWSSSLTPFFATATAAALYAGIVKRNSWLLASSGLLAALTLQAHPTSAVMLIGMLLWFLLQPDLHEWLRRPAPYLAAAFFLIGYAPMIWANARLDSPMLATALLRTYAFVPTIDPLAYITRLFILLRSGASSLAGGLSAGNTIVRLTGVFLVILLSAGVVFTWRRGNRLIAITAMTSILLLPIFLVGYSIRYFVYMIPLAYATLGILVAAIWRNSRDGGFRTLSSPARRRAIQVVIGLLLLVYTAYPLVTICTYYQHAFTNGLTNEGYFQIANILRTNDACTPRLFIEEQIPRSAEPADLTIPFALNAVDYVLTLNRCDHQMLSRTLIQQRLSEESQPSWLIIPAESVEAYSSQFDLELVISIIAPQIQSSMIPISLYRVRPRQ
jgi:4-amino-4-deoxy-L-arabinose transferase-like glycosyltransferase